MHQEPLKRLLFSGTLLIGLTLAIAATGLDLRLAEWLYTPGTGFVHGGQQPWAALYEYGEWPGLLLATGALALLLAGLWWRRWRRYRMASAFLVLLYLLGPGLLVNLTLKEYWGRPRPVDLVEFGGTRLFSQPWRMRTVDRRKSFPSGHASVAFYLGAPYFLLRNTRKRAALVWLAVGVGSGLIMGAARMAQGGHFLSDILWAGGLVYLTGLLLSMGLGRDEPGRGSDLRLPRPIHDRPRVLELHEQRQEW